MILTQLADLAPVRQRFSDAGLRLRELLLPLMVEENWSVR